MSKGEYDDYGRGYEAGREAAADEIEKLQAEVAKLRLALAAARDAARVEERRSGARTKKEPRAVRPGA